MQTATSEASETGQRRRHVIEMIVRADTPISHGDATVGNAQKIRQAKIATPKGRLVWVPVVSGNAMRHGLREAGSRACLEASGLRGKLTESALRLLFNGGVMKDVNGSVVRLDEARRLAALLPHLSLLGGCMGNRIVEGKMEVRTLRLICQETQHLLPQWMSDWMEEQDYTPNAARQHVEEVQSVKMDALLSAQNRELLLPEAAARYEQRMLASDVASARGDAVGAAKAKSGMMPYTYETVVEGSLFAWSLCAWTDSEIERDTLAVMIAAFFAAGRVAGKSGTGHGAISVVEMRGHERIVSQASQLETMRLAGDETHPSVARYRAHMQGHAEEIEAWLREVQA